MRKCILFILLSLTIINTSGQTPNPIVNTFGFHKSFNGSGDLGGFSINVTKRKHLSKSLDWFYGSSLTFHFGKDYSYEFVSRGFPSNVLNENDPMKFYTFGIQGESGITLKLFEKKFPIHISTGPIIRYQSTSYPTTYGFYYNPTRFPDPFYTIKEIDPNTLSPGYKVQLEIGLGKVRRSRMYFNSYFQNDTNGDVITGLGLVFKNLSY
jgi:hypothetical protein